MTIAAFKRDTALLQHAEPLEGLKILGVNQIKPKAGLARRRFSQKKNQRISFVCCEKQKSKQNKFVCSFFGRTYSAPICFRFYVTSNNPSVLKEKVLLLFSWQNMRWGFGRPLAPPFAPSGSKGPVMYSSKYIVGLTKAGFQDCYEIPIIMISLSLCTAQGLKEMNNQRYTASALQSFLGPAKKGQS